MNKTMTLIGGSMLLLSSNITPADDGAGVANEVRQQTRTQVQGMPAEEGMNQRTELQTRLQSMTEEERALYEKLNSDKKASGDGTGKKHRYGKGDGTGKQHRYG
ncbi:MAG: hypothetical protein IME93_07310, partial [Proteobacteria bacterium]|nr:hypothetical protein [Pseudomonadota bacterium]